MSDTWYYAGQNGQVGPLTLHQLREILAAFPNGTHVPVWRAGLANWTRAGEVPELFPPMAAPVPQPQPYMQPAPQPAYRDAPEQVSARRGGYDERPRPRKGGTIQKALIGIAAVLALLIGIGLVWQLFSGSPQGPAPTPLATADLERDMIEAERIVNADLPRKVDEVTTLTRVTRVGTMLIYAHQIAIDGSRIDETTKVRLREQIVRNVCSQREMRIIMIKGGGYRLGYTDIANRPVIDIDVTKDSCP